MRWGITKLGPCRWVLGGGGGGVGVGVGVGVVVVVVGGGGGGGGVGAKRGGGENILPFPYPPTSLVLTVGGPTEPTNEARDSTNFFFGTYSNNKQYFFSRR